MFGSTSAFPHLSSPDAHKLITAIRDQTDGVPPHLVFVIDIVSVRFGGYFTPQIKAELQKYSSLQMLTLNDCGIKSLDNFPHLPTLIRLDVVFNQIVGEGLQNLRGSRHLQTLMLGANKIQKLQHLNPLTGMKQLLQLDLINNPVSKLPGYRNQIFLMFPTITILDTLDKGGKDAYTNPSMIQAASRVPDSLFDKSAPVPAPVFIPPPPVSKSPSRLIAPSKSKSKSIKDLPLARKASKSKVVKIDPPVAPVGVKSKKVVHTASKRSKILASSGRSKSSRAGLSFPVARIKRKIKNTSMGLRVGNGSAVYMAAVLEYLTAELLEIAGNEAKKDKKQRIVPSMIRRSLKADEEMNNLLKNVTIGMIGQ